MVIAADAPPPGVPPAGSPRRTDPMLMAVGAAAGAVDLLRWSTRGVLGAARVVPGVGRSLDALASTAAERGAAALGAATELGRSVLRGAVREVVAAALLEVDLTRIVREHVDLDLIAAGIDVDRIAARVDAAAIVRRIDLDAIVDTVDLERQVRRIDLDAIAATLDLDVLAAGIDVDAVAARIDIDAIIARLDLIGLANRIIDGVDLPQIIRDSTGSLSEEAVRGVRSQGMQADDAVAGFVGRLFGRDRHNHGYPRTGEGAGR
ncbi:hypothetical protein ACWF62_17915 [Rhodococcus sp. NPDC054953]